MKKIFSLLTVAFATSASVMAGGLNTNTNANAAYLRFFAQEANVSLTSLYANPAGSAFLGKGFHFGIHNQTAIQQRNVTTTFPLFIANPANMGSDTHRYEGKAFAPVIPSIDFSYNSGEKWSVNAHLGLVGGGGACEYLDGIGSFESMYAKSAMDAAGPYFQGYGLNAYMKGSSFMYGLQVGATYKVTDNLAFFAGIRGVYATANYNGYVQDFAIMTPAGVQSMNDYTLSMNCDQTGFGVTPILGVHWTINEHWNVAAKYEFKTKIRMENTTRMNNYTKVLAQATPTLANFVDGAKVPDDIPGYLAIGTQYSPIQTVRIGLGYHWMQDASANKGLSQAMDPIYKTPMSDPSTGAPVLVDKRDLINHDTHEILASIEWKCCERLTISGGWQKTMYGVSDDYMNDVSFNLSSNSMGLGMRIHASKLFNIDLGYMHTFYQDRTVTTYAGQKTDVYNRHNDVVGVGLNFAW